MKLLDKLSNAYKGFFRRRRVSVINPANNHEEWFTHVSPMGLVSRVISVIIFVFIVVLFLAGYTSILQLFPEYLTESDKTRNSLLKSMAKIDSIEANIFNMRAFNDNIALIMEGNSPITYSQTSLDTLSLQAGTTIQNNIDILLREQMELSERYNLNYQSKDAIKSTVSYIDFVPPIEGIIIQPFDKSKGECGIKMTSSTKTMIYASDGGVVMSSIWSPDFGYIIQIIHPTGSISVYRHLSKSLVEKGENIGRGEVIGYNNEAEEDGSQLFEFELWIDGKPVNPEHYINF
ncbi:MAG: M23 family metallopeptidase [Rikenellaceae bacterium]